MSAVEAITAESVRQALYALHYAKSLESSSLLDLILVDEELRRHGVASVPHARQWGLGQVLQRIVRAELDRLRDTGEPQDWERITTESAIAWLQADFTSDSIVRESWGAVYFRYLSPVRQPVQRAASEIGLSQRLLHRRALSGCRALSEALHQLELETERKTALYDAPRLPIEISSLVGRDADVATVCGLLEDTRLLTLTGTGGTGKTRLALRVAAKLRDRFPDGVFFVDLSVLDAENLVARAVADALLVREEPNRNILETIGACVAERTSLLVLDNCEHVLTAATVAAETLLLGSPHLRVLATSREPLRAQGEWVWSVPPLGLPGVPFNGAPADVELVLLSPAVELFVERARSANPDFYLGEHNVDAVASLCNALDGVPLAIELSAARTRMLTVTQQLERFNELFDQLGGGHRLAQPRQQTLKSALDWSYHLLDEEEQRLFRRLAIFRGGWTLEAAEAVAPDPSDAEPNLLQLLGNLIDKSLVTMRRVDRRARYGMLEVVRSYALGHLEQGERSAVRRRHLTHFVQLAEAYDPQLTGPESHAIGEALTREHDNLRAALEWAIDTQEVESALRLASALGRFWDFRGHFAEGLEWLERALALPGAEQCGEEYGRALNNCGRLLINKKEFSRANELVGLAERHLFGLSSQYHCESLNLLGIAARRAGDLPTAQGYFERYLEEARSVGRDLWVAGAINNLGIVTMDLGDWEAAETLLAEGLSIARDAEQQITAATLLFNLGSVALELGQFDLAETRFTESLRIRRATGDSWGMVLGVEGFGWLAAADGQPERAARLLAAAEQLRNSLGRPLEPVQERSHARAVATVRRELSSDVLDRLWNQTPGLSQESAIAFALGEFESDE